MTSSVGAVFNVVEEIKPQNNIYDESYWSNPELDEGSFPYLRSNTIAERAAWDFIDALPVEQKFELVTICPGFVVGPPLRKDNFTSAFWVKRLLEGQMMEISATHFPAVDVRDVAEAHLLALKNDDAANRRYILVHSTPCWQDYVTPIAVKYRRIGWPITKNFLPQDSRE